MSDFVTTQEYLKFQQETAIPKLRWWQVQALADTYSNDQELGSEVVESQPDEPEVAFPLGMASSLFASLA